jgi:hypothetical protein
MHLDTSEIIHDPHPSITNVNPKPGSIEKQNNIEHNHALSTAML